MTEFKILGGVKSACSKAFTLAETLIVIGIIGVVAALTLPNLNHATGDKETVTRLMKAYSMLNEANDRAVATYGPISEWKCTNDLSTCYMKRIGEFLKISKSCNEADEDNFVSCEDMRIDGDGDIHYILTDGTYIRPNNYCEDCSCHRGEIGDDFYRKNICMEDLVVDIDGLNKGKNSYGVDRFNFFVTDDVGVIPVQDADNMDEFLTNLFIHKMNASYWVINFGNLDYLKVDEDGKCNDSNIVLDGVNNTSCH